MPRGPNVLEIRIKQTSSVAAGVLAVFIITKPIALAFYVSSNLLQHHPWLSLLHIPIDAVTPVARFAIFTATLLALAPWLWGLWQLRRLFLGYRAGNVFTPQAASHFSNFALSLIITGIICPIAISLLSLVLSALGVMTPPGGVISISSTDVGLILIGSVLRVIASVLLNAARLAEENASFV